MRSGVDICTVEYTITVQMSSENNQELRRFTVAAVPLITATAQRLDIRAILSDYVGGYGNELVPAVDAVTRPAMFHKPCRAGLLFLARH